MKPKSDMTPSEKALAAEVQRLRLLLDSANAEIETLKALVARYEETRK